MRVTELPCPCALAANCAALAPVVIERAIGVEPLDPVVASVCNVDAAVWSHRDVIRVTELPCLCALAANYAALAPVGIERAIGGEPLDSVIVRV